MSLLDVLDETKRWAEERLFPRSEDGPPWSEVYPPVDLAVARLRQELEDATSGSTSREVIDTLRGYLAATPDDVAVRWTVLGCLYAMGHPYDEDDDEDDDDYDPYWDSSDRERFAKSSRRWSAWPRLIASPTRK